MPPVDVDVRLGINLSPESIRKVQSDINAAIRVLNPELNISLEGLQELANDGLDLPVNLSVFPGSVKHLRQAIENATEIRLNKIGVTARAKQALKDEIESALVDLQSLSNSPSRSFGGFQTASDVTSSPEGGSENDKAIEAAKTKLAALLNQRANIAALEVKSAADALSGEKKLENAQDSYIQQLIKRAADSSVQGQKQEEAQNSYLKQLFKRAADVVVQNHKQEEAIDDYIQKLKDRTKAIADEKLGRENKSLEKLANELNEQTGAIAKGVKTQEDLNKVIARRVKDAQAEGKLPTKENTFRGPNSGKALPQVGGIGDIQKFAANLNTRQLEVFNRIINQSITLTKNAAGSQDTFGGAVRRADSLIQKYDISLNAAQRSAFEFGVSATNAAQRLLAWATPATFIFSALSSLRAATNEIIALDREARRLTFFDPKTSTKIIKGVISFGEAAKISQENMKLIIGTAKEAGLSIEKITEAFLVSARTGQPFITTTQGLAGGAEKVASSFVKTVNTLVRFEAGALSAEEAATGLNAILNQFGINDEVFKNLGAVENIGAVLAAVADESSFSVSQLIDATTRLGATFSNLQGIDFAQAINLVGVAADATGASAERLGTLFRQLGTLSIQNADKIKELTGIEIIGAEGAVDFQASLDVLRQISRLGPEAADQLARLIFDRRNLADGQALAASVSTLDQKLGNLSTNQAKIDYVAEAAARAFLKEKFEAQGLEASITSLSNKFTELTNNTGIQSFLKLTVSGVTSLVNGFNKLVSVLEAIGPAILAIGLSKLAPLVKAGLQGVLLGATSKIGTAASRGAVSDLLGNKETASDGIKRAQDEGLISEEKASKLQLDRVKLATQELTLRNNIGLAQNKLNDLRGRVVRDLKAEQNALNDVTDKQKEYTKFIKEEDKARKNLSRQITGQGRLLRAAGGATLAAGAVGGTFLADAVRKSFKGDGKDVVANAVGEGLGAAIEGGIAGALTGFAVGGPIGLAVGAIGGSVLARVSAFSAAIEQTLSEQANKNLAQLAFNEAAEKQAKVNAARRAKEDIASASRTAEAQKLIGLTRQLEDISSELEANANNEEKEKILLERQTEKLIEIENFRAEIGKKALSVDKEREKVLRNIASIRKEETRFLSSIEIFESTLDGLADTKRQAEFQLVINEASFGRQLDNLGREISKQREFKSFLIEINANRSEVDKVEKDIEALRDKEFKLRAENEKKILALRRDVVDRATDDTQQQISAWEAAAQSVVGAFAEAVGSQSELSSLILSQADAASEVIANRANEVASLLEARGASVETRIASARRDAQRQIAEVNRIGARSLGVLRSGGAESFKSGDELAKAASQLTKIMGEAARLGNAKAFDEEKKTFNLELSLLRQRAEEENTLFGLRIQQTKAEIDIRRRVLSEELSVIQGRISSERELNNLKNEQQREFGRILLQGPEEFLAVAKDIKNARNFFKGVGNVNKKGLETISNRSQGARQTNQFAGLQSVVKGLEALTKIGGSEVISGTSNAQLQEIFEKIQARSPEDLLKDIEKQRQELEGQTSLQKALKERQERLAVLAETEATLSSAQLRINQEANNAAIQQRDALLLTARESLSVQKKHLQELVNLQAVQNNKALDEIVKQLGSFGQIRVNPDTSQAEFVQSIGAQMDAGAEEIISKGIAAFQKVKEENDRLATFQRGLADNTAKITEIYKASEAAVGRFNSAFLETAGILTSNNDKLKQDASGVQDVAGTSVFNGIGGGADLIKKIESSLTPLISSGGNLRGLKVSGEGIRDANLRGTSSNIGNRASRRLLESDEISGGLESSFRDLLGGDSQFIKSIKELRGTGARGARNLDPDRVRELLSQAGLSGVASDVDTRGEAVQLVDKLVKFADELNKTPDKLSERATTILRDLLATEIKQGFANIGDVLAARRNPVNAREGAAADAASTDVDIFSENNATEFGKKFSEVVAKELEGAFVEMVETVGNATIRNLAVSYEGIFTKVQGLEIKVPALEVNINGAVRNIIDGERFLVRLTETLAGSGVSEQQIKDIKERVAEMVNVMVRSGQLTPDIRE